MLKLSVLKSVAVVLRTCSSFSSNKNAIIYFEIICEEHGLPWRYGSYGNSPNHGYVCLHQCLRHLKSLLLPHCPGLVLPACSATRGPGPPSFLNPALPGSLPGSQSGPHFCPLFSLLSSRSLVQTITCYHTIANIS